MKSTLIVHFDSNKIYFGLIVTLIATIALIFLFPLITNLGPQIGTFMVILMRIIFIFLIALFSLGLIYSYFWDFKTPAAVLSPEGIWINNHGFIAWDKIAEMKTYTITGAPLDVVGVLLKDPGSISKQSSFSGKCVLFWAKLFGYRYHINLACIALSNSEVMAFAQPFLNKKT